MPSRCENCGAALEAGVGRCVECGRPIGEDPPTVSAPGRVSEADTESRLIVAPPDPARRPRWGRAIATVLAIVAVAASAWVLVSIRDRVPDPFDDSWVVLDTDASTLRVMFSGVGPERIVRYTDSSSTRCGGIPAQAEGIGRIEEPGHLVFDPSGLFRCDDGSIAPSGTFQWVHDLATDTLVSKGKGLLWERDS